MPPSYSWECCNRPTGQQANRPTGQQARHNGRMRALVLLVLLAGVSAPAQAQSTQPPPPPESADSLYIDPTKLGVSLERIQKGLRIAEAREQSKQEGLRLEYNVQVFGQAPRIDVLSGFDLYNGIVPDSAPTHREFLEYVTPPIYRTPGLPLSTFAAWAAKWVYDKSKAARCEQEIANYRELLMQGVNVAAPRCTQ